MRFVVSIDTDAVEDPRVVAHIARGFLQGVILQNRLLLRQARRRGRPYPELYKSGVVFKREAPPKPGQPRIQQMVDLRTVLRRRGGDCKHLCAWRVAELQEAGEPANIKIYWRQRCKACGRLVNDSPRCKCGGRAKPFIYHAEVRRGDGSVEDVSRYLGM